MTRNLGPGVRYWLAGVAVLLVSCDPSGLLLGGTESPVGENDDDQNDDHRDDDDQNDDDQNDDDRDYPEVDDGTCSAWKFAYCDAVAACSAFETRQDCELDLGWLVCDEHALLGRCQAKIESALDNDDCEALPTDCNPAQIADRSLVVELCRDIHLALCEHRLFCGLELSLDGCVETLARVEPCGEFTSFLPTAVDCAEAYSVLGCGEPMPEVCAGSLRR